MKKIIFILPLLFFHVAGAQTISGVSYPVANCVGGSCPAQITLPSYITASYFDSVNEVIYLGGRFDNFSGNTRNGLAAIDAITGNLLPWNPAVNNGTVTAITKSGDSIFVGGTFTQINGITRNRIAAISKTTSLLFPDFSNGTTLATDSVLSLLVLGNNLYVGGRFSSIASTTRNFLARFSVSTGIIDAVWNPVVPGTVRKNSFIGGNIATLFDVPSGPSSEIATIPVSANTVTSRAISDPNQNILDFALRGNVAFLVGNFFAINSIARTTSAAVDLTNGTLSAWNPVPSFSGFDTRNKLWIAYYRDSLFIGTMDIFSQNPPYHRIYVSHYVNGGLRILKQYNSSASGSFGYFCDGFLIGNARMFEIERYAQHGAFPYGTVDDHFSSYCMKPPAFPGVYTIAPTQACPGDTNILYSIQPLAYFYSYTWSPTNPGIVPSGNSYSTLVDFLSTYSVTASLRVYGVTSCGISSTGFRSIAIAPKSLPNVTAGPDDTLSCITTQLELYGASSTAGAIFSWNSPSGTGNADSILATLPGNYFLTVHGGNGCWKTDTAVVVIDTLRPSIIPFSSVPTITCRDTIAMLNANALYPSDSLYWNGPGLLNHDDPANAMQSANYLLTVMNRNNGCTNGDTVFVPQNINPPNANVVAPDTVLTCNITSVILDANSNSNSNVIFQWRDTSGIYFSDPDTVSAAEVYQLYATDTSNGCVNNSNFVFISSWTTAPGIVPMNDSAFLNCSYSSITLNATSLTNGATLQWSGPSNYSSSNPATANQTGNYFVTATHPQTGCTSFDSVFVDFQMTLDVRAGNDTTICPGSGASLGVTVVGGTPAFNFSWNNSAGNSQNEIVFPADTLVYVVNVNDAAGCTGTDSVIVNVPGVITDSVHAFQPCDPNQPTGQLQVFANGGVPPFSFSIDNGTTWNNSGIFSNLNYGNYFVLIRDALGCSENISAGIDTNSLAPRADFLVSTSPQQGDTIVVVDISDPRPDSVHWEFPVNAEITDSSMFSPSFVNADTGACVIVMHAYFGACEVVYARTISIHPFDSSYATLWNNNGIDTIILYPNPNNGIFNLDVRLYSKQDFVILVNDANGNEQERIPVHDAGEWNGTVNLLNPAPGNYILRVIAEFDSAEKIFVIAQ
ncbi:MAG: hypothetical protein HY064_07370 [Bacteroidetes bacterium]|nr:hypothetical protein [Bacteroidota bacterium]